jgi:hypothetical protein
MANLTLRSVKGSPLTNAELDGNFEYFTGSHAITGSLIVSGSITSNGYAVLTTNQTGSFVTSTGNQTITGSLSVNGSVTISGSNTFINVGPMTTGDVNNSVFNNSLAQGYQTTASGSYSHAEGFGPKATGNFSHAEGWLTTASGIASHAEGQQSISSGSYSHAEGYQTLALGQQSHAEGYQAYALGQASHAEGLATVASGAFQHVQGQYNTHGDTTSLMIVGNGASDVSRKDAFKVRLSGSIVLPTTQSSAPSWTGTDGEMVFATVTGNHRFYVWMAGAWRSGSLA